MIDLVVSNLSYEIRGTLLVKNASFRLNQGELVVLLGPNGAGKTLLLRNALGLQKPKSGQALLAGDDTTTLSPPLRARRISYLPQTRPMAWPTLVRDVVALGRFSYGAAPSRLNSEDAKEVETAIAACDISHLAHRTVDSLSGGELARVHCARAFAADTPLLIADEPVAALDLRHQFRVMDLCRAYVKNGGGAMIVLHDVALAARYADRLVWMKDGEIVADGPPSATLSSDRIAELYRVQASVHGDKVDVEGIL